MLIIIIIAIAINVVTITITKTVMRKRSSEMVVAPRTSFSTPFIHSQGAKDIVKRPEGTYYTYTAR